METQLTNENKLDLIIEDLTNRILAGTLIKVLFYNLKNRGFSEKLSDKLIKLAEFKADELSNYKNK